MSKGGMDTFSLVINYLNDFWTPMHVTIGLLKVHEIRWFSMVRQLHTSLEKYDLMNCVVAFVKDENNLMSMVIELHSIIDCQLLKLKRIFAILCLKPTNMLQMMKG
jgi:hypothetical protein